MRGEFIAVWDEVQRDVWRELAEDETAPRDLFCELFRELSGALRTKLSVEALADIIDDPDLSRAAFLNIRPGDIAGERALVRFLESVHEVLSDLDAPDLIAKYATLIEKFIERFSLRYEFIRPFSLSPTLAGIFASLLVELKSTAAKNDHLADMLTDFEGAIRDLNDDASEGRIKTCILKQVNLLEALARSAPGVNATQLSAMCDQLKLWPHEGVKKSLASLYGFTSDYPGIRHGGNPAGEKRKMELRDVLAVSIVLAGFTPYLNPSLDPETIYRRL